MMRFAGSFCVVFLLYFVHVLAVAVPLNYEENSEEFAINEVDPSMLETFDYKTSERPVRYVTAIVRNKRHFDYSDYSSESSEENRSFEHYNKRFGPRWQPYSSQPPQHTIYAYWRPGYHIDPHARPQNFHHHHNTNNNRRKQCKFPFGHAEESEESSSSESSEFSGGLSTERNFPSNLGDPNSTRIPSVPKAPSTENVVTTTTSTEFPFIDVRGRF